MPEIQESTKVPAGAVLLDADIVVPAGATGVVAFAHGSGSSRASPRNRFVAHELQQAGLATVLLDLLLPVEDRDSRLRFDITLLSARLVAVVDWLVNHEPTKGLGVGLFGASTGAAAALVAAATRPLSVATVVSRGGRPDLAEGNLRNVHQPVLLIVGERDPTVLELNRRAQQELAGEARLVIVPGATHLFEEPGALEVVARLARDWFLEHLHEVPPGQQLVDDLPDR